MIKRFIKETRLFELLYEDMDFHNEDVHDILIEYINKYISYKSISSDEIKDHYENFLKQYSKDAKKYKENNVYPAIEVGVSYNISRQEYDVFLLLSTILTQHRYDIMCEIHKSQEKKNNALVIGSGVGIEIELINKFYKNIDAYDIEIDEFCYSSHQDINFYEKEFIGEKQKKYDNVYIIELLEHVPKPYNLIKKAKTVLNTNGSIIITLAINIPQFDHIINFDNNDLFLKEIDDLNLYIYYEKEIKHKYLMNKLTESSNVFMILKVKQGSF